MVKENKFSSVTSFFAKIGRRNLIIIGAVLLIGAAVWLNWIFLAGTDNDGYGGYDQSSGMVDNSGSQQTNTDSTASYFSATMVSRQRARDEAIETYQSVLASAEADSVAKNQALEGINQLAADMENESNIETLVKAKGFSECVAVINGEKATIVVKSEGLLANEISQINEIVYEQAGIKPVNVVIVEKK